MSSRFTSVAKPGAALRAFRRKQGWTLAEVSQKTSLPVSTLSRIETDQISPTYDQLSKLSVGLCIDMAQLLSGDINDAKPVQTARRSVNRAGDGQILDTPMQSLRYLSVDLTNKQFAPIIGEIKAHSLEEAGEFHRHNGEEFIFVVSGELELHSESYTPLRLRPGDSVYFDSSMPHAYVAVGKDPCKILSICTAPFENVAIKRAEDPRFRRRQSPAVI
ncbi:MAG TPA: XRE family transcriptional regulator [Steroidobacteraceae bacterium]|nr:XRE family transcriptional regulator [Steroidobacteraceae bacterium]